MTNHTKTKLNELVTPFEVHICNYFNKTENSLTSLKKQLRANKQPEHCSKPLDNKEVKSLIYALTDPCNS